MRSRFLLLLLSGLAASTLPAEKVVLEDSLLGATVGEPFGGELTSTGFRPEGPQDHILYRVPVVVAHGALTFEVRGMRAGTAGDQAFLAIYDGRGIAEPARYFEDFRENYFRFNVHWRGSRGAMKCVVNCARATIARRQAHRAVFAEGEARDWVVEPTGRAVDWDPKRWYRVCIEWSETEVAVTIDDQVVWKETLTYPYRPEEPRIWLGCAPGYGDKYTHQVAGLTYRNFRLVNRDEG